MIEGNFDVVAFTEYREVTLAIPNTMRDTWQVLCKKLFDKRISQVYIKLGMPRKPRTTGKNSGSAHFHGHCRQISEYTGEDFEITKLQIKMRAIKRGYPSVTTRFGYTLPQSEADCSTVEESMLIEEAHEVASWLNIKLREE